MLRTSSRSGWPRLLLGALLSSLLIFGCQAPPAGEEESVLLAYVANAGTNHVQVIDVAAGQTLRRIYAGTTPWRLVPRPGGRELWVQHWLAETTAVIDLESHEVRAVLPARGPGLFAPSGERFLSFSWPGSGLSSFDAQSGALLEERSTEISRAYEVSFDESGENLYLLQHDPISSGGGERYAYLVSYPLQAERPLPGSVRTGVAPLAVVKVPGQPFVLTADSESASLTLLNMNGDGRSVPTCGGPRRVLLGEEATRLVVLCWDRGAGRYGEVVVYHSDFTARPWPTLEEETAKTIHGGPVDGALAADGGLWILDEPGHRLVELDVATLDEKREIAVGAKPADLALVEVPRAWREALVAEKGPRRQRLEEILARLQANGAPFTGLRFQEKITWQEPAAEDEDSLVDRQRELATAIAPPDRLRRESDESSLSLAAGGVSLTVQEDGRFWAAPRQELLSRLLALPALELDEAVRSLAGDLPDSPRGTGGLAVDLVAEIVEDGRSQVLVGALEPGQPVAQLWIDAESGLPATLIEQFPATAADAHQAGSPGAFVETRFLTFQRLGEEVLLPSRLERVLDGRWHQQVSFENAELAFEPGDFDLARLGGFVGPTVAIAEGDEREGEVPILEHDYIASPWQPHPPYTSSPPSSGPRLRDLADWGVSSVPVPWPLQVHNLEHGGVTLQYRCTEPCPELVAELTRVAEPWGRVIIAPWPFMEARIALTAWGRVEYLDEVDEARITAFLEAWEGRHQH